MLNRHAKKHHINPRFRAYGRARIDIAQRAQSREDWHHLWKEPSNPFPFTWGENWKQCIEYKVDDFAAEVGFFIDILGLPINAFDPDYAMFTSPAKDFYFSVVPAFEEEDSTPPDALRIQFMVADIFETVEKLERRGVEFEQQPQSCQEGSSLFITYFRTPHGICVDLWGFVDLEDNIDDLEDDEESTEGLEDQQGYANKEVLKPRVSVQPALKIYNEDGGENEETEGEEFDDEDWDNEAEEVKDFDEEPKYVYDDEEENSIWKVKYS